jgi:hypothetical protein
LIVVRDEVETRGAIRVKLGGMNGSSAVGSRTVSGTAALGAVATEGGEELDTVGATVGATIGAAVALTEARTVGAVAVGARGTAVSVAPGAGVIATVVTDRTLEREAAHQTAPAITPAATIIVPGSSHPVFCFRIGRPCTISWIPAMRRSA